MGAPYRQAVERQTQGRARVHPQEPIAWNDEHLMQVSSDLVVIELAVPYDAFLASLFQF